MNQEWVNALLGGILIGISVSLMLLWNGRVTGISGIINGALSPVKGDTLWRLLFVVGLFLGGLVINQLNPELFGDAATNNIDQLVAAGLLVGFGTILGSGCTSGHGVCGISRLSLRSIIATIVFIVSGIMTVYLLKQVGVYL